MIDKNCWVSLYIFIFMMRQTVKVLNQNTSTENNKYTQIKLKLFLFIWSDSFYQNSKKVTEYTQRVFQILSERKVGSLRTEATSVGTAGARPASFHCEREWTEVVFGCVSEQRLCVWVWDRFARLLFCFGNPGEALAWVWYLKTIPEAAFLCLCV